MKMTLKQFCANCVMLAGAVTALTGAAKSVIDLVPKGCVSQKTVAYYNPNSKYLPKPPPPPSPRNIKTNEPVPPPPPPVVRKESQGLWWSLGPALLLLGFLVAWLGKRMKRVNAVKPILLLLLFASPAVAKEKYGSAVAVINNVYDGDTLTVTIENWPPVIGEHIGVRLYGVDTRELHSGGIVAKQFVQSLLPEGAEVVLFDIQRDKYFRILARVGYNCKKQICQDLSTTLITEKYAVPYFGETKTKFPKEIK